ncbi:TPM domain-containing protein [Acinetobacter corruptisaponis]|uniref:TPM domain-containing protein n=1 Tax=Acinetobacter corruptisaponis TaxID=3045147 RepID=A0ABY8S074_9GAMM|nr:TPM domain-containing protein [Acinetobacter sp. KCTC 92772]WHP04855.1 TPM domain-containing protein [Acinetobacter sp. KCTC 92772]
MVTKTDTTQIITQPKLDEHVQPSLKRWFKHFLYISSTHRYFNKQDRMHIANAVQQAEKGHVGEIQVVIEGHIPCSQAYHQNTRLRAQQLFAELGVWDTELNSGVLLYLNLCERKVEIVIDRGLKHATQTETWNKICQNIIVTLVQKEYLRAVTNGVNEIGQVLDQYYVKTDLQDQNELPNEPIILK